MVRYPCAMMRNLCAVEVCDLGVQVTCLSGAGRDSKHGETPLRHDETPLRHDEKPLRR